MKAKTAWGPNPGDADSRPNLSTSPMPSLPEGRLDTDTTPSPSPSLADSPRSQQRTPNGAGADCRRSHSPKHQRKVNGHQSSSSPRHSKNVRGESSSLARRQGGGREGERERHVSGTPNGEVGSMNLLHYAETLGVIEEVEEGRVKKQRQADGPLPGPEGDEQGEHPPLSDPRSGVVIHIIPSPAPSRGPATSQSKAKSSSSTDTGPHSRADRPRSARTASKAASPSSSGPHGRQEEEDGHHSSSLKASNHPGGPAAFPRAHNAAGDSTPRSSSSAISPATSRPSSARPHSRQGSHSRPGSSRPGSRHSSGGRAYLSSRQESYREGERWRRLRNSGEEWDESSGSRSHPGGGGGGGGGESVNSHSLTAHPHSKRRTVRRRPWTAPPTIRVRQKKDYMEREEAYQASLRDRQGGANGKTVLSLEHHPHFSDEAKQKHEEVIRQILDDFDLEETKNKYRNANACELRRKGNSIADFKFRSELMRIMGSEVIRISDNTWSTRFQQCLRDDYERKLDVKEIKLAEVEKDRIHRLRLEGIMRGAASEQSEDLTKKALSAHRLKSQRKFSPSYLDPTRWVPSDKEPEPIFQDEACNTRERLLSARRTARTYQAPVTTILEELQKTESLEETATMEARVQDAFEESMSLSWERLHGKRPTLQERRRKIMKRLPPPVVKLYEAETVASLYNCAEKIVGRPTVKKVLVRDPKDD